MVCQKKKKKKKRWVGVKEVREYHAVLGRKKTQEMLIGRYDCRLSCDLISKNKPAMLFVGQVINILTFKNS